MSKREIKELIQEQSICRIAFKGGEYPYMAPFQYVVVNGQLYFHFTDYGKKMKLLEKDNRVCVGLESFEPNLSEYSFVVLMGKLKVVTDVDERAEAIDRIASDGKRRISPNFLAAHGVKKEEGWSAFTPEKPFVIVKLEIEKMIGLKSP